MIEDQAKHKTFARSENLTLFICSINIFSKGELR